MFDDEVSADGTETGPEAKLIHVGPNYGRRFYLLIQKETVLDSLQYSFSARLRASVEQ
ncbi:hypothetical protein BRAO375_300001 [Bradyrhizobium sp. ORS 375]|nr:hypothetical protein BRAO375_300001 [Bradyrhizobium sp. ORS 375]